MSVFWLSSNTLSSNDGLESPKILYSNLREFG
jgi:hypothetical protein